MKLLRAILYVLAFIGAISIINWYSGCMVEEPSSYLIESTYTPKQGEE